MREHVAHLERGLEDDRELAEGNYVYAAKGCNVDTKGYNVDTKGSCAVGRLLTSCCVGRKSLGRFIMAKRMAFQSLLHQVR